MAIFKGILVRALSAFLAAASVGALLGYVSGWAPCHGVPYPVGGAHFGIFIFLAFIGLPAGVGGAVGGGVAGSRACQPVPENTEGGAGRWTAVWRSRR